MKLQNNNNYYETSDFGLATTISLSYPLEGVDRTNPSKALFIFKRDKTFGKFIEAYWRGDLRIEPKTFFSQMKILKSRLYSEGSYGQ